IMHHHHHHHSPCNHHHHHQRIRAHLLQQSLRYVALQQRPIQYTRCHDAHCVHDFVSRCIGQAHIQNTSDYIIIHNVYKSNTCACEHITFCCAYILEFTHSTTITEEHKKKE